MVQFHGVHSHLQGGSSALSTGRPRWKLPEGSAADLGSSASSRSSNSDFVRERQSGEMYWLDVETFELRQVPRSTKSGGGAGGSPGREGKRGDEAKEVPSGMVGHETTAPGSGSGSTGSREGYWPRPVKNHTLSSVDDRYVLSFGGRYPGSEGARSSLLTASRRC